ncbi:hypothetical protein QBC34DRAFT_462905 [Podospora aff. communis PSN243]|uniref:Uncharacterized protein n=1 Tax=Podospora aff. communis PSN243 TaxID=3040156 RepID=A0AAV9GPL9_9PEZI|nr:hypothetical protein QBC34DRAFT_462905 [Podospora aff. communis PSN243]
MDNNANANAAPSSSRPCRIVPPCQRGGHGTDTSSGFGTGWQRANAVGKYHMTEDGLFVDLKALKKGDVYRKSDFLVRARAWFKAEVDRLAHLELALSEQAGGASILDELYAEDGVILAKAAGSRRRKRKADSSDSEFDDGDNDEDKPAKKKRVGWSETPPTRIQPSRRARAKVLEKYPAPPEPSEENPLRRSRTDMPKAERTTPQKTTPQKTTPQKTTPQKTTPQKTTPQKTTPQKAPAKDTSKAKKTTAQKAPKTTAKTTSKAKKTTAQKAPKSTVKTTSKTKTTAAQKAPKSTAKATPKTKAKAKAAKDDDEDEVEEEEEEVEEQPEDGEGEKEDVKEDEKGDIKEEGKGDNENEVAAPNEPGDDDLADDSMPLFEPVAPPATKEGEGKEEITKGNEEEAAPAPVTPEPTAPEPTAPESAAPEPDAPEPDAPEPAAPEQTRSPPPTAEKPTTEAPERAAPEPAALEPTATEPLHSLPPTAQPATDAPEPPTASSLTPLDVDHPPERRPTAISVDINPFQSTLGQTHQDEGPTPIDQAIAELSSLVAEAQAAADASKRLDSSEPSPPDETPIPLPIPQTAPSNPPLTNPFSAPTNPFSAPATNPFSVPPINPFSIPPNPQQQQQPPIPTTTLTPPSPPPILLPHPPIPARPASPEPPEPETKGDYQLTWGEWKAYNLRTSHSSTPPSSFPHRDAEPSAFIARLEEKINFASTLLRLRVEDSAEKEGEGDTQTPVESGEAASEDREGDGKRAKCALGDGYVVQRRFTPAAAESPPLKARPLGVVPAVGIREVMRRAEERREARRREEVRVRGVVDGAEEQQEVGDEDVPRESLEGEDEEEGGSSEDDWRDDVVPVGEEELLGEVIEEREREYERLSIDVMEEEERIEDERFEDERYGDERAEGESSGNERFEDDGMGDKRFEAEKFAEEFFEDEMMEVNGVEVVLESVEKDDQGGKEGGGEKYKYNPGTPDEFEMDIYGHSDGEKGNGSGDDNVSFHALGKKLQVAGDDEMVGAEDAGEEEQNDTEGARRQRELDDQYDRESFGYEDDDEATWDREDEELNDAEDRIPPASPPLLPVEQGASPVPPLHLPTAGKDIPRSVGSAPEAPMEISPTLGNWSIGSLSGDPLTEIIAFAGLKFAVDICTNKYEKGEDLIIML